MPKPIKVDTPREYGCCGIVIWVAILVIVIGTIAGLLS